MTAPFFVVGSPRSGTTLLRTMLDGHARLAVPPESHFVVVLWARRLGLRNQPEATLAAVLDHPRFRAWELDADVVRAAVRKASPATYAELMAAVFAAYAESHGKPRWGDKTPLYGLHIPLLSDLFSEARFLHVIRDGREVAASLAARPTGAPNPVVGAFWWRKWVGRIRSAGARLPSERYCEIRYEELVSDPERVLRTVCAFIDEPYDPAMLDYPQAVAAGATVVAVERHPNLLLAPRPGIRDWRAGLTPRDQSAVEAVAGAQLAALGYPTGPAVRGAWRHAWRQRAAGLVMTSPRTVRRVMNRRTLSL